MVLSCPFQDFCKQSERWEPGGLRLETLAAHGADRHFLKVLVLSFAILI
jgi:hypothetical protein